MKMWKFVFSFCIKHNENYVKAHIHGTLCSFNIQGGLASSFEDDLFLNLIKEYDILFVCWKLG